MADKHQYGWLDDDAAERLLRGVPVPGQSGFGGARRERNEAGPTLADQGRSEAERIATAGVGGPGDGLAHAEDHTETDDLGALGARPTAAGGPATPGRGAPTTHDHPDRATAQQVAAQRLAAVLAAVAEDAIGPLGRLECEEGPLPGEEAAVAAFRAARAAPAASADGPRAEPAAPTLGNVHGAVAALSEGPRAGDGDAPLAAARDERGAAGAPARTPGAAESASDARGASAKNRSTLATGRGRRTTGPSATTVVGRADTGPGRKGRPARGRPVPVRGPLRAGLAAALVGCALGSVAVAAGTGVLPTPFRGDVQPAPAASVTAAGTSDGSVPQPKISGATGTPSDDPSHARPPGDGTRPTESASARPDGPGRSGDASPSGGATDGAGDGYDPGHEPGDGPDATAPGNRPSSQPPRWTPDPNRKRWVLAMCRDYVAHKNGEDVGLDPHTLLKLERAAGGASAVRKFCAGLLNEDSPPRPGGGGGGGGGGQSGEPGEEPDEGGPGGGDGDGRPPGQGRPSPTGTATATPSHTAGVTPSPATRH
ncbi:hypothetical protein OYE22_20640 [Streptomyces sp. 71268]|uniref:hypothetical protein n=1 Tax=Streptomyces sp. 71268 TaxID=3002640 RepID=UPI0023F80749|nr:hypothetical protein [Streptomyces sp. 71268]WEV27336.1 hypothetical protein OYE22_20640 [Streptomyces sp. 71268]